MKKVSIKQKTFLQSRYTCLHFVAKLVYYADFLKRNKEVAILYPLEQVNQGRYFYLELVEMEVYWGHNKVIKLGTYY